MEIKIDKYTLVLSAEALHILDHYIQRQPFASESGGVVMGRIVGDTILVERLSIPTELDKSSRMHFERHRLSAQMIINYEHTNTYGQVTYLGEWHTHPEDHPSPSQMDLKMIRQQFHNNKIHTHFLVLLIQGKKTLFASLITKEGIMKK